MPYHHFPHEHEHERKLLGKATREGSLIVYVKKIDGGNVLPTDHHILEVSIWAMTRNCRCDCMC